MNNTLELNKKELAIVLYLASSNTYRTSFDIATNVGINRRQVRIEMATIKAELAKYGFTVDSRRSKGYCIIEQQRSKELIELVNNTNTASQNYSHFGRCAMIQTMLFMEDDQLIKLDDIAENLYVSRSTITNDFVDIEPLLSKHNLTVTGKNRGGLQLAGKEVDKREFFLDTVYNNLVVSNIINDFLELFTLSPKLVEYQILQILKKKKIWMSDTAMCDTLLYLTISIHRIQLGKILTEADNIPDIDHDTPEYQAAADIARLIEDQYAIELSEYEIQRFGNMLVGKRSARGTADITDPEILRLTDAIFQEIYAKTRIDLKTEAFRQQFAKRIRLTISTLTVHEKIRNPYYKSIIEKAPLPYTLAKITSQVVEEQSKLTMSSSHLAYYATVYQTEMIRQENEPRNVLLICGLSTGASDSMKQLLYLHFAGIISNITPCFYTELNDYDLRKYDFIVSTFPINKSLPIPVITVSMFLLPEDIRNITNAIYLDLSKFHPELYFNPSFYLYIRKKTNMTSLLKMLAKQIGNIFLSSKESYIYKMIRNEKNRKVLLTNGVFIINLENPFTVTRLVAAAVLRSPIVQSIGKITMVIILSEEKDESKPSSMQLIIPLLQKYTAADITAFAESENTEYADFIDLLNSRIPRR